MINAVLVVFAGIYSLIDLGKIVTLSVSYFMLAFYLTCFGCLLCCFEMRVGTFEVLVREHFGFMFSNLGRTLFLFFLASFCFGIVSQQAALGYIVGVYTILNALFNLFISYKFGLFYVDPTSNYNTAEGSATQYIRENPELARSAVNASLGVARENPNLARSVLQSASHAGGAGDNDVNPFSAV